MFIAEHNKVLLFLFFCTYMYSRCALKPELEEPKACPVLGRTVFQRQLRLRDRLLTSIS